MPEKHFIASPLRMNQGIPSAARTAILALESGLLNSSERDVTDPERRAFWTELRIWASQNMAALGEGRKTASAV